MIEAVATGRDRAAFVTLFEHFAPRVKTFLLRSGASEATAEEFAQETMLTVWRKADSFVPGSAGAAAWIFTIARNLRIDALRREWRNGYELHIDKEVATERHLDELTPEAQVSAIQLEHCVRKALAQLSGEQLRVIELSFFEEKAHGEIAEQLQIPLGTVKSRSRLAIARLRTLLGDMS
jgi:RNA polymerase sigma-70 factor (ECF subfamily)